MKILLPQELQFFTLPAYNAMVSVEEADVSLYDSKILIVGVLWLQSAEEWLVRRLMPIPWLKCWLGRRISDWYQCWVWPLTSDRAPHTTTPSTTSSTKKHAEASQRPHGVQHLQWMECHYTDSLRPLLWGWQLCGLSKCSSCKQSDLASQPPSWNIKKI